MYPMKAFYSVTFLLTIFSERGNARIPKNVIIEVSHACGSNGVDDAKVSIVTDIDAEAVAKCADGDVIFPKLNMANFQLPVSYPGKGSSDCVFHQKPGSRVYAVTVLVSYGERNNPVHQLTEEYTLTCTFDPKATTNSTSHGYKDSRLIAPVEIQSHAGTEAKGNISLILTDILGNPFNDHLTSGRIVQLMAATSGADSEVGVHPTSCDAIASSETTNKTYAILRGGCGDGIVIPKNKGFVVDGLVARSPFFEGLSLAGFSSISFECTITLCMDNCDGDTCNYRTRRRRSIGGTGNRVVHEVRSVKTELQKPRSRSPIYDVIFRSILKRLDDSKIRLWAHNSLAPEHL